MGKVAMICNGYEEKNIFPAFVLAAAAVAGGDDVIMFFEPEAAPALVRGALEALNERAKGWSDLMGLLEGFQVLGGRMLLWGNINPMLMLRGRREEVKAEALEALRWVAPCGGFMLGDGANVCPGTPIENLAAPTEAAEDYGVPERKARPGRAGRAC